MSSEEEESVSGEEYESEEEVEEEGSGEEEEEDDDEEEEEEEEEEVEVAPVKTKRARKGGKKKKDPNKPKRNQSAFFLYSNAHRAQVKAENPNISFGEVAKILSKQFKELPEKEVKKWQKKADKDKVRYQEEMKGYVAPSDDDSDGGGKKRKKKAKKDPNKPKRNQSAFFLYSNAHRAEVKTQNPDASFGDIAKIISVQFKALPDKEKKKWEKKAEKDKKRYQEEMTKYNAKA